MTIEEKLKDLVVQRYGTMRQFSKEIGMSQSTFATIMKRGIHKASISNILIICKALGISADELANDRIVPIKKEPASYILFSDIPELLDYMRNNPNEFSDLTIDGQSLSDLEFDTFLNTLTLSIEFVRDLRKKKQNKNTIKG